MTSWLPTVRLVSCVNEFQMRNIAKDQNRLWMKRLVVPGRIGVLSFVVYCIAAVGSTNTDAYAENGESAWSGMWDVVKSDYLHFYSSDRLKRLGIAYGVGGIMANTAVDENIQDWYQEDMRSTRTDDAAEVAKLFGEGKYMIPLSLLAAGIGTRIPTENRASNIGRWGERTARAYAVGAPPVLLMQRFLGSARPGEADCGSHWNPFNDTNGVSGHAFIGAVPFLTLARMGKDHPLRYIFYVASGLAGWSRINDNAHYTSQAFLGWFMAWEAAGAVSESNGKGSNFKIQSMVFQDTVGVQLSWRW
jgi:hypothetical protein